MSYMQSVGCLNVFGGVLILNQQAFDSYVSETKCTAVQSLCVLGIPSRI